MKNWIIAVLVGVIAIGGGAFAFAQSTNTATVEVTVWRSVSNPELLYLSTRPEGGRWTTHNEALDMSQLSASGRFYQSNSIEVEVPLPDSMLPPTQASPESAPTTGFGSWVYFTGANVDGELEGYRVSGESPDHYSWDLPPILFVRCSSSGTTDIFMSTSDLLFNNDNTDRVSVTYRFSGGTSVNDRWWSNEDLDSTLFASSAFEASLRNGSGTLYIQATDGYTGDSYSASFPIDGVANAFAALPCF